MILAVPRLGQRPQLGTKVSRRSIAVQAGEALSQNSDWQASCSIHGGIKMASAMFKITQNTLDYFTFAEVLLLAAMNQVEAKQKADSVAEQVRKDQLGVGHER